MIRNSIDNSKYEIQRSNFEFWDQLLANYLEWFYNIDLFSSDILTFVHHSIDLHAYSDIFATEPNLCICALESSNDIVFLKRRKELSFLPIQQKNQNFISIANNLSFYYDFTNFRYTATN